MVGKATSVKLLLDGAAEVRIAGSRENFLSSLLSLFSLACFSLAWLAPAGEIGMRRKKKKREKKDINPSAAEGSSQNFLQFRD